MGLEHVCKWRRVVTDLDEQKTLAQCAECYWETDNPEVLEPLLIEMFQNITNTGVAVLNPKLN